MVVHLQIMHLAKLTGYTVTLYRCIQCIWHYKLILLLLQAAIGSIALDLAIERDSEEEEKLGREVRSWND